MAKFLHVCSAAAALLLFHGVAPRALFAKELEPDVRAAEAYSKLQNSERQMRLGGTASDSDKLQYLVNAVESVYWAKVASNCFNGAEATASNDDLQAIVDQGYLNAWPLNPFNGWKPMRVLSPGDPFSPGDLVLQLCPSDQNSFFDGTLLPMSFALSVNGPSENWGQKEHVEPLEQNEWTRIPTAAVAARSYFVPSASEREQHRKWKQSLKNKKPNTK